MSGNINAFPSDWTLDNGNGTETTTYDPGMKLRDYFAAKAMQAVMTGDKFDMNHDNHDDYAEWAYRQADAMMLARAK